MLFVLDTVSGAEAKSVPFTTRMHLPFAQQFDKHKLNASRAIRDKDYLTCAVFGHVHRSLIQSVRRYGKQRNLIK